LSALQKTIKEALDFFDKETAKNLARKAKRLK